MNINVLNDNLSSSKHATRRQALRRLGLGAAGLTGLGVLTSRTHAQQTEPTSAGTAASIAQDIAVLQFALNLEYLEAEYYTYGATGHGIEQEGIAVTGQGAQGPVIIKSNPRVPTFDGDVRKFIEEIAEDERTHVRFLRQTLQALGATPVARPLIDLRDSWNALAQAASINTPFDPFANAINFLVGAFVFEDVGVSAYRGAAPLLESREVLSGAAGLLGTEAYHAATIRSQLFQQRSVALNGVVKRISDLRDALDGASEKDQGISGDGRANIVPTNFNGLVRARTVRQVLNIVYFAQGADKGGFFPNGINVGS